MQKMKWTSRILLAAMMISGCSTSNNRPADPIPTPTPMTTPGNELTASVPTASADTETGELPDLQVRFGYDGESFILTLDENETAEAIARYVGEADWNLPIYHYDDYENYEVMQYYDIPSRYTIPSDPQEVTEQLAGEVYYSEPNRILLFYHDAEVVGELTRIGTFDATAEFVDAVESNPVVEGWSNKIVSISRP